MIDDGSAEGTDVGALFGKMVGIDDGATDGAMVGKMEGNCVGASVGVGSQHSRRNRWSAEWYARMIVLQIESRSVSWSARWTEAMSGHW